MKFTLAISDLDRDSLNDVLAALSRTGKAEQIGVTQTAQNPLMVSDTPEAEDEGEVVDGNPLDAEGLPWDARIHSSSKAKTAKGVWKARKNVDKDVKTSVEAELRAKTKAESLPVGATPVYAAPMPVYEQPAPMQVSMPEAPVYAAPVPAPMPVYEQPTPAPMPVYEQPAPLTPAPMPAYVAPAQAPVPAPVAANNISTVMRLIQSLMMEKKIDINFPPALVAEINRTFNTQVLSITDIGGSQPMIDFAIAKLQERA